jgi:hypothetical protein
MNIPRVCFIDVLRTRYVCYVFVHVCCSVIPVSIPSCHFLAALTSVHFFVTTLAVPFADFLFFVV